MLSAGKAWLPDFGACTILSDLVKVQGRSERKDKIEEKILENWNV